MLFKNGHIENSVEAVDIRVTDGKFEQIGGTGDGSSGGGGTCEEIQRIDKNTIDKLFD